MAKEEAMWNMCRMRSLQTVALAGFVIALASLPSACGSDAPAVDRATLWMDTVKHGDLTIQARGPGNLDETETGSMIATVRIPESQSFDLAVGQRASVDTRNGIVEGRVAGIADRIEQGTAAVTIELRGELPEGSRPGLSIDVTIDVKTIEDVLYVGKPAFGEADTEVGLFKIVDGGEAAVRVRVQFGASAINLIEVVSGLTEGDEIILSDMARWDVAERILLR